MNVLVATKRICFQNSSHNEKSNQLCFCKPYQIYQNDRFRGTDKKTTILYMISSITSMSCIFETLWLFIR